MVDFLFRGELALGSPPQAKSAKERIEVVSCSTARRQFLQLLGVSAADNDLIDFKGNLESSHDRVDELSPFALSEPLDRP